jgi:archaellum component FlaC
MEDSNPSQQQPIQLSAIETRVKKLEDEVFKGGPPGFGDRLARITTELENLKKNTARDIASLDAKIDRVTRIVAELRRVAPSSGGGVQGAN